jgi:phosphopantetheine--protein transferase-like protein
MHAVGTDLVSVENVAASVARYGGRFLQRIFTPGEVAYCHAAPALMSERLATRFAAKEAVIKILRPGNVGLDWRTIEVVVDPSDGAPRLALSGVAAALARARGIRSLALSLSHEAGYATATVVASLSTDTPGKVRACGPETTTMWGSPTMIDTIRSVIRDHARLSIDMAALDENTDLYRAGMTSHASVNLMLALEAAFDIEFPERMLNRRVFQSIAAIRAALEELKAEARLV